MKTKRGKIIAALSVLMTACLSGGVFTACGGGGSAGKPVDPFDESGFNGGVVIDYNAALETDADITVDGKLEESKWSQSTPFISKFDDGVEYSVKTLFGDKGLYVAFSVKDTKLYGNPTRATSLNSCMELYLSVGTQNDLTGNSAIEYRHDVTGKTERYVDVKSGSSYNYSLSQNLPVFSRMQVHGTINSGESQGADFEAFVRWDALCSDYMVDGSVNPDFVKPETVGIVPAYDRSSGPENTDDREQWCLGGGNIERPVTFFRFDGTGYTNADAEGATVGDSSFGRNKTAGWNIEKTEGVETATSTLGYAQAAYFKGITESDYVATALIEYKNAYNDDADPIFGMIAAANQSSVYSFTLPSRKTAGNFLRNNVNRENDDWASDADVSLGKYDLDLTQSAKIRMTVVKRNGVLFALVGDENTEKFGGTLVALKEVGNLGTTAPGFFTNNCEVAFSDYEVKQGTTAADEALSGKAGQLVVTNVAGGTLTSNRNYYIRGEQATVEVSANRGYKLTSLKVSEVDVLNTEAFQNGILTATIDADTVTVVPAFEQITETMYNVTGRVVLDKVLFTRDVSVLITGKSDKGYVYRSQLSRRADYTQEEMNGDLQNEAKNCNRYEISAQLPNGEYSVVVNYFNGARLFSQDVTVADHDASLQQVVIRVPFGESSVGAPSSGTFRYLDEQTIQVSESTASNLNRTYLKELSGTKYVFKATVKIGKAWNNDPYPTVGIIFAGLTNITYSWHMDARNYGNAANNCSIVNILSRDWFFPFNGKYEQGADRSEVNLMVVRDGAMFYLFANDKIVTTFTTPNIKADTETCVGFSSVASLSKWTSWEFSTDEADVKAVLAPYEKAVTVTVNGSGTYEVEGGRVIGGHDAVIKLNAAEGYFVSDVTVNGSNAFSMYDVATGILTLKNVQQDLAIEVTFSEMGELVNVTGSYGFGELDEGSSVEIYIGVFEATVNEETKTFTASVPSGTYTLRMSCDKYVGIHQVTVGEDGTLTPNTPFVFDTFKLSEDLSQDSNGYITVTQSGAFHNVYFANAEASGDFAMWATMKFENKGWPCGIFVEHGGEQSVFIVSSDRYLNIRKGPHYGRYDFNNQANADNTVVFIYKASEDTYYFIYNGCLVRIDADSAQGKAGGWGDEEWSYHFGEGARKFGLSAIDCDTRFKDYGYTTDATKVAQMLGEYQHTVTVTVEGGHGTHDFVAGSAVYQGENVAITLTPDEGYRVATIKVNDVDAKSDYDETTGIFTLKNVKQATTVIIVYESIPNPGTVSGSYAFAQGLDVDSNVKIMIGAVEATLDKANKTFTASIPAGTYTVTMSCDKYVSVTDEVTVAEEQTSDLGTLTFDTVKLASDAPFTYNPTDKSYTATKTVAYATFAASDCTNAFALNANITYNEELWSAAGFIVCVDETRYEIGYAVKANRGVQLHILCHTPWTEKTTEVFTTLPTGTNTCTQGIDVGLIYQDGTYYAVVGNYAVYRFDATSNLGNAYASLLDKTSAKQLGIITRDTANAVFKEIRYTTDAENVAQMLEGLECTVTVTVEGGNGTHDFVAGSAVYQGENVAIKLTPNEKYRVATIKVNDVDAKSDYDEATGIFTLKNVQDTTAVVITFEKIPQNGTVSGSYSFGNLDADSSVKITIGAVEATLDTDNKTFTASIPAGTYTVTMSCDKYVSVTQQVTVNEEQNTTAGTLTFDTPKLEENQTKDGDGYVTITKSGSRHPVLFTNAQTDGDFAIWAKVKFASNATGWTGGFVVQTEVTNSPQVIFLCAADNTLVLRGIGSGNYGKYNFGYKAGEDNEIVLIYKASEKAYYFIYNGCVARLNETTNNAFSGNDHFAAEETRKFGLAAVDFETKFKDYGYTTDAVKVAQMLGEYQCTVTVTVEGGNGTHDFVAGSAVYQGENVAIKLTPNEKYRVATIKVNDVDAKSDYDEATGIFTLKNVQDTTAVVITFEKIPQNGTVSGSYSFGNLDADSSVKITIGAVEATLDTDNKTFTASIPAGTYTVTMSCDKYVSVTQQVTVNEEQNTTAGTLTFDTPKLEENQTKDGDGYVTITKSGSRHPVLFTNAQTDGDFAIWAKVKFASNATGWTGGFVVQTEVTNSPQVIFLCAADNTLVLRGIGSGNYGKYNFGYKAGEDNEIVLIYKASEKAYYFIYNGCVARLNETTNNAFSGNDHFAAEETRKFGLAAVDFETKFKDYGYTTDAVKVAQMLGEYQCTVTVTVEGGNGTHDFVADSIVYQGENVDITLTPDEGYRVATVKVNNAEAKSDYDATTGIFTLKNAQKNTLVTVTFEEIPSSGTVAGSYGFGNMDADTSVEIYIGSVKATVDTTAKTFTAELPAGTYTLTMSCNNFVSVTQEVTVTAGEELSLDTPLTFDTPKLVENLTKDSDGYVTVTKSGGAHAVAFANAETTGDFAMWATIVPAGNGWAGGIYVGVGTDWSYFIVSADNYLNVRGGAHYGQHAGFNNSINADNKVVLIYKASEDAYYFIYNGCLAKMTRDNAQGKGGGWGDETYVKQFGEGTRTFGLAAVDNPTKFKEYGYTTDSTKVDAMLQSYQTEA